MKYYNDLKNGLDEVVARLNREAVSNSINKTSERMPSYAANLELLKGRPAFLGNQEKVGENKCYYIYFEE